MRGVFNFFLTAQRSVSKMWTIPFALVFLLTIITTVHCQCSESNKNAVENILVNETVATFNTPGYRVAYFSNMACTWIFDAGRTDATIVLEVQELLMENSRNCAFDSITIYEGNSASGTVVKRLCGRMYTGQSGSYITVSGQYATLVMRSDRSRQYAGAKFELFYAIDNAGAACSGTPNAITATLSPDFITSPGFPIGLDNGVDCSWTITCQAGAILRLDIVYSDLFFQEGTCWDQVLAIYDGSTTSSPVLLDNWCDSSSVYPSRNITYFTTGNVAHVTLITSPESIADKHGFRLDFRQNSTAVTEPPPPPTTTTAALVQSCSDAPTELEATDSWQFFQTLDYPNYYPNGASCKWRIKAPAGYTVNVTFVDVSIQDAESCARDAVTIYDGQSSAYPRLVQFCHEDTPVVHSTGRYMYVVFRSDNTINFRGFSAKYSSEQAVLPPCTTTDIYSNLTATVNVQEFTSPDFPNNYNNSMTLYWMISNPNETEKVLTIKVVESVVEASSGCIYDFVKIINGPCQTYPGLGKFCGVDKPEFTSTGAYTLVQFTTDSNTNYQGFRIQYYLTDKQDDDTFGILILTGIIVGSVLGGVALVSMVTFGVYKYLKHRNKVQHSSRDSSRRSSASSLSSTSSFYRKVRRLKLSDLLKPAKLLK